MLMRATCSPRPRSQRVVDGLIFGSIMGVLGGAMIWGMAKALSEKDSKAPVIAAVGMFGLSVIVGPIAQASAPEC
jgi:hypothetical protein